MRIFVTGGAGYIGSHCCKHLVSHGHEVMVYDNLSTGFRQLARWGTFRHGDLLNLQRLRECLTEFQPQGVIHFAASSYVGESVVKPELYFRNNVCGTLNLLDAMRLEKVPHIVVSGTCAVYGQPDQMPIAESCPKAPINPYGAAKLFMERMLEDFETAYGLSWASLRYFNAAGCDPEGQTGELHQPETHIIPRIFMAATGQAPLHIFGNDYPTPDGTCIRDYIHVVDLAQAHRLALEYLTKGSPSIALNLGTGTGISLFEMLRYAEEVCQKNIPYTLAPRRQGDPAELVANPALAAATLQWKPTLSDPHTLLSTAWHWFCNHCVK